MRRCIIRRLVTSLLVVAVGTFALWYTVWPPRTDTGYRHQALQTLNKLQSQVATARLWGRELDRDHSFMRTVRVGLGEMESDATSTVDQFSAYQPPQEERSTRSDVTEVGDKVVSALGELRIAAREGRANAVVTKSRQLDELVHDIQHVKGQVR
jgi:hypothetical protein